MDTILFILFWLLIMQAPLVWWIFGVGKSEDIQNNLVWGQISGLFPGFVCLIIINDYFLFLNFFDPSTDKVSVILLIFVLMFCLYVPVGLYQDLIKKAILNKIYWYGGLVSGLLLCLSMLYLKNPF